MQELYHDPEQSKIPAALGISDERLKEMEHFVARKMVDLEYQEKPSVSKLIIDCWERSSRPEESLYCVFMVANRLQRRMMMNDVAGMIIKGLDIGPDKE